jgi:hypothetical protein
VAEPVEAVPPHAHDPRAGEADDDADHEENHGEDQHRAARGGGIGDDRRTPRG